MSQCVLSGLLVLPLFQSAPALSNAQEPSASPAAAASANEIPIELRENFPHLVATLDGMDVSLKFDLGDGSALVLQQSVLDRIKAIPTGESAKLQGIDGVFESPMYKVARVQIGTAVFTDVIARVDVRDSSYQPGQTGEKGYLGTGLLKSHEVVLDYPHRTMTLIPQVSGESPSGTCKGTVVPFLPKWNGEPVSEAQTDLGRVILWWDTGAPTSVLRKALVQEVPSQPPEETVTTKRLTLGGTDLGPWQFDLWDMKLPGFDGFIGYDFFARHVVCVDFPGKRLVIGR